MRSPLRTMHDLGIKNSIAFQLVIAVMANSAFVNPLLLYSIVMDAARFFESERWRSAAGLLFFLDATAVRLGDLSFGWLAWQTSPIRRSVRLRWWLFGVPLCWLLLSFSARRAIWQLPCKPQFWE